MMVESALQGVTSVSIPSTLTKLSGLTPVSTNLTLSGYLSFDPGAMLQPAAGVTITFANAYIDASDFQQIFDLSQGGAIAGSIYNDYHCGVWYGADYTGSSLTGAAMQAAFDSPLTPNVKLVRGNYDCTGTELSLVDHHLICESFRAGGGADGVTLKWKSDLGAGAAALSVYSAHAPLNTAKYRGFQITGPGQAGAAPGNVGCQMDGIIFGNGGNHKFDAKDIFVSGVRFPYTAWCNNGHSSLDNLGSSGNYATWCILSTGGDWKWTNCSSNAEQRAAFYLPKNGSMGVHADLDDYFCGYTPYFAYQSNTFDPRLASTTTAGLTVGSVWNRVACERLGNAFINLVPTDSSVYQLKLVASGWDALQSNATVIAGEAQDFAIKAGYIEGLDLNDVVDAAGAGTLAPFKTGVIQVQNSNSRGISACRIHNLNPVGTTFLSGTTKARIIPQTYNPPTLTIAAGKTSVSYTALDFEACSRGNWVPVFRCAQNLGAVTATLTTNGSVVTITLSAPLSYAVSFTVNLYGPGI
jgi:hypothetical protein